MPYDLVVAYRICPKISKIPPAYPTDKYKLSKFCLESFKRSMEGLKVKIFVIADNCGDEYLDIFKDNFDSSDLEIISLVNCGNKGTFKRQIEVLSAQKYSDIVYFAEDDYYYIKNIKNMIGFLKSGQGDFVTPYEHPGSYEENNVIGNKEFYFGNQKYLTVQHACLTFMTTKEKLLKNQKYLLIFSDWFGSDFVVWGCITLGFTFFKYFWFLFDFKNFTTENLKIFGSMIFFAWHRFLFNKKYRLCMPVKTLATHMESTCLSPGVDWNLYFEGKN